MRNSARAAGMGWLSERSMENTESAASQTPARGAAWLEELASCWRALPAKGLFFGLLGCWLLLFHLLGNSTLGYVNSPSLFGWLYGLYTSPFQYDDHGLLIPWVVLALFWWKRRELIAVEKRMWWPGLVLLAAAMLLHVLGFLVQQSRLSVVALFLGIYGLSGAVWGPAWLRASFFPFLLFAFCVPMGSLSEKVTFPLRMWVTQVSVGIGQGLGMDVIRDGSQIFDATRSYQYDVAPACSGIRSLMALAALSTCFAFMTFRTWWKRLLIMALALPLAFLGNVVRLTSVIVAAEALGQKAGTVVHDWAGFVVFLVAIGSLLLVARFIQEDPTRGNDGPADSKGMANQSPNITGQTSVS